MKTLLQDSWGALTHEDHYKRAFNQQRSNGEGSDAILIYELFRALGGSLAATDQIAQQIRNTILRQERLEWEAISERPAGDVPEDGESGAISDDDQGEGEHPDERPQRLDQIYKPGDVVQARVEHIPLGYYGALARLQDDTKGLCHISEIDYGFVSRIEDYLQVGETYDFVIRKVDPLRGELQLSRLF